MAIENVHLQVRMEYLSLLCNWTNTRMINELQQEEERITERIIKEEQDKFKKIEKEEKEEELMKIAQQRRIDAVEDTILINVEKSTRAKKVSPVKKASTPVKNIPAKKVPAKKSPAKKLPTKKVLAKKVPAKKVPTKKVPTKK